MDGGSLWHMYEQDLTHFGLSITPLNLESEFSSFLFHLHFIVSWVYCSYHFSLKEEYITHFSLIVNSSKILLGFLGFANDIKHIPNQIQQFTDTMWIWGNKKPTFQWMKDATVFRQEWMPIASEIAYKGTIFNWSAILSANINSTITTERGECGLERSNFYISYLLDAFCSQHHWNELDMKSNWATSAFILQYVMGLQAYAQLWTY